jgi:hypothetical protein
MIDKENIFVNECHWRNMSNIELEIFVDNIFHYYRINGFPYYSTDNESRKKDFDCLMNYNRNKLIDSLIIHDTIQQTMHGLGLAWSYFPHAFNVKSNNKMTPYEAFMNDEIFKNVIRKRLKIGTYISDSGIRKMLKIYTGVQGVSNFRPTAAALLYETIGNKGVVWDMSGGWGGRLLGAIAAKIDTYIVTEPSLQTYNGLCNLANDFATDMHYSILNQGSEDFKPFKNTLDLCFTSPPYYNLEKYSDEQTQSYIKFPTKKEWIEGFLEKTFENCYYGLKSDGYMLINIADLKNKNNFNLETETIISAEKVGFKYIKPIKLALSNVNLKDKTNAYKYEPIFIFKK